MDGVELSKQKGRAGGDFISLRRAILRRAALHHVADVNIFSRKAHRLDHLCEQFTGPADKREALRIFIRARALADENQFRARTAVAEDDCVSAVTEAAARTVADIGANFFERVALNALGRLEERRPLRDR